MIYRVPRSPELKDLVQGLWFYDQPGAHARERLLASSTVQLLVDLAAADAFVAGPSTRPAVVSTRQMVRLAGVVFLPGGVRAFTPPPVDALRDATAPLLDLWGDLGRELPERISATDPRVVLNRLEAALLSRLDVTRRPARAMRRALQQLAQGGRVAAVADAVGLSKATLGRRLRQGVGLSPKGWASLSRFRRAAHRIAAGHRDYAEVALDVGFYDQAHLIQDFRRYAGLTPATYRPKPGEPNHVVEP